MMPLDRRAFLAIAAGMVAGGRPTRARAAADLPRIGVLPGNLFAPDPSATDLASVARTDDRCLDAFRRGLAEAGQAEGTTYVLDVKPWVPYNHALDPRAAELARTADVIVVMSVPAAHRARAITRTVPIVLGPVPYPAEIGLVQDVRRPAANVTGMALWLPERMQQRVAIFKEAVPGITRLAALFRSPTLVTKQTLRDYAAAGHALGITLVTIRVTKGDVAAAVAAAAQQGADAAVLTDDWLFVSTLPQIAALALRHRLPVMSASPGAPNPGILLSHVPPVLEVCRASARFVDRILRGARAADLPIEQAGRFHVTVDLRTARALGLTLPPATLARADRVIR